MKEFVDDFKLYAYKKYDICDLSLKVTGNFVLTYRFTHNELKQMFSNSFDKEGVNIRLNNGTKLYAVVKKNISALRLTINTHGGNFNLRYEVQRFTNLIAEYERQMNNPVDWDNYDPR